MLLVFFIIILCMFVWWKKQEFAFDFFVLALQLIFRYNLISSWDVHMHILVQGVGNITDDTNLLDYHPSIAYTIPFQPNRNIVLWHANNTNIFIDYKNVCWCTEFSIYLLLL